MSTVTIVTMTSIGAVAENINLGEISVTATKTERKVGDVPASIEVITQEEIQSSVAQSVDELLKNIAGVDIVHNTGVLSTGSTNKVIIRGVGGTGESRTLLLIDGVPMNSAFSGSVEWNQIPLESIERIEILKGANSALYGSNAMGGVVNIITKKAKGQKTHISLNYGSMNTKIGSITSMGKAGKFGYLLSAEATKSDGYVTQLEEDIENNTIKTGVERKNAMLKLSYDIDPTSTLSAAYSYYNNEMTGELEIPSGYNPGIDTIKMLQANYTKKFNNNSELKITFFDKSNDSNNDYLKNPTTIEYYNSSSSKESGGALQYSYLLDTQVITAGFDFQLADVESHNDYPNGKKVTSSGEQDYYAFFVQDEIFIGENIIVNIGGRFDRYQNHDGEIYDEKTKTYAQYPSRTLNAFSPKLGILYRISPSTSLKGSIGQAFRAPSVNDLYKNTVKKNKISAGNPNLDPETISSIEMGVDQKIGNDGIFSIVGYRSIIKDYIYSLLAPASSPYYKEKINVGEAEISGIETELNYNISPSWSMFANYTYTKATIEAFEKDISLEGKDIIRVPRNKASGGVYYKTPNGVNAKASIRYVGKRYENDKNTVQYDSYVTCDLKISKKINNTFEFAISIEDLFDREYEEKYVSPGRVVMGNLSLHF